MTNMVIDKQIWTCATCGQGFTRRPSADRHNINLHSGRALVIRTLEYIIGRVNGRFPAQLILCHSDIKERQRSS